MLIKNRAENCVIKAAVGTNFPHFCEYSKSHEMRIFFYNSIWKENGKLEHARFRQFLAFD